ncbi:LuxR family transcriptional regulator [Burkholderia lata]|uniref:response regulator transcription factor n=1 Tax=Burkholderia lata (strain ATCC 17760 / DSM 23089 / LMG 22485 / NCIMB 9086 / R18194 / 383) TaxID=482957 RepID=UPI0014541689|nr:response regulator transcription factor [Burkholderia lata]VWD53142.1 LuxR family transcriptional regulator [Burkholderia lata]
MKVLNVVLADDHPAVMVGLRVHVGNFPGIRIVGEVRNSTELVDLLDDRPCDVIVTDYAMPGGRFGDGLALLEFLRRRYPSIAVIVYTAIETPALLEAMQQRGTRAVLSKIEPPEKIAAALRSMAEGFLPADTPPRAPVARPKSPRKRAASGIPKLTRLEAEIVRLYVAGLTIDEIAKQRNRTKQTISAQKQSAKRKLNITRDFDLIRYMTENGFSTLSETAATAVRTSRGKSA